MPTDFTVQAEQLLTTWFSGDTDQRALDVVAHDTLVQLISGAIRATFEHTRERAAEVAEHHVNETGPLHKQIAARIRRLEPDG